MSVTAFQLFQLRQGVEIDVADVVELATQLGDFLIRFLAAMLLFVRGRLLQLRNLDLVIVAEAISQRAAFVPHFVRRQVLGMLALLEFSLSGANGLDGGHQLGSRGALHFAAFYGVDGFFGQRFLEQVQLGQPRFSVENVGFGKLGAPARLCARC